jgi:hypothetical protein
MAKLDQLYAGRQKMSPQIGNLCTMGFKHSVEDKLAHCWWLMTYLSACPSVCILLNIFTSTSTTSHAVHLAPVSLASCIVWDQGKQTGQVHSVFDAPL